MRISFILKDVRYGGPHAYAISLINELKENNDEILQFFRKYNFLSKIYQRL